MALIEVIANDRLGRKGEDPDFSTLRKRFQRSDGKLHFAAYPAPVRVKCSPDDTVGDLKKLIAAQTGTASEKIQLKKWYIIYKDHITLADYEIHDGMSLEMY